MKDGDGGFLLRLSDHLIRRGEAEDSVVVTILRRIACDLLSGGGLWYRCASCGNRGLAASVPDVCACGAPNWKLLRKQVATVPHGEDWEHPDGEV